MNDDNRTGKDTTGLETATFGGGCFWCLEPVFADVRGVVSVEPGYAGGNVANPSYEQVCSGRTGHAEVVQVQYNPSEITYPELLNVFFAIHGPTTLNRQGADVGTQYRSVILYHDDAQKEAAEKAIRDLDASGTHSDRVVTQVVPFEVFYPAEQYHHGYFEANPYQPYCNIVIAPKIAKFRKQHADMLKAQPAEASST